MIGWVVLAFIAGGFAGMLVASLMAAAAEDSWKIAYLDVRDRLWKLEREQEHA